MSETGVLVERDAELRVLERALEAVEGGSSPAVGIVGEAGIGKSRLRELGDRAAARGHVVLAGRAAELERDVPFALWVTGGGGSSSRLGVRSRQPAARRSGWRSSARVT
jgi:predicted ATPase